MDKNKEGKIKKINIVTNNTIGLSRKIRNNENKDNNENICNNINKDALLNLKIHGIQRRES